MVGLPYPNPNDPVLKEKMIYINAHTNDKLAGQEYYENLCMKAVNQSIGKFCMGWWCNASGRSIRHKDDYAVIVLADRRYNSVRIEKKLPKWIGSSLTHPANFGEAFNTIATFFRNKKDNQTKIEELRASKSTTFSKHIPSLNWFPFKSVKSVTLAKVKVQLDRLLWNVEHVLSHGKPQRSTNNGRPKIAEPAKSKKSVILALQTNFP